MTMTGCRFPLMCKYMKSEAAQTKITKIQAFETWTVNWFCSSHPCFEHQPLIILYFFSVGSSLIVCLISIMRTRTKLWLTHLEGSCLWTWPIIAPLSFCKQLMFTPIFCTLIKGSFQRCATFSPSERAKKTAESRKCCDPQTLCPFHEKLHPFLLKWGVKCHVSACLTKQQGSFISGYGINN